MTFRLILVSCILSCSAFAENRDEAYYQKIAAEALKGETEVTMPDGSRADIITEEYAIEVEKADNWKESIGQALNYAFQSNKKAGIVLVVEKPTDSLRLMSLIYHYNLRITVWTISAETRELVRLNTIESK